MNFKFGDLINSEKVLSAMDKVSDMLGDQNLTNFEAIFTLLMMAVQTCQHEKEDEEGIINVVKLLFDINRKVDSDGE